MDLGAVQLVQHVSLSAAPYLLALRSFNCLVLMPLCELDVDLGSWGLADQRFCGCAGVVWRAAGRGQAGRAGELHRPLVHQIHRALQVGTLMR